MLRTGRVAEAPCVILNTARGAPERQRQRERERETERETESELTYCHHYRQRDKRTDGRTEICGEVYIVSVH